MNRFYLIVPLVLLLLFGGVFWQHNKTAAAEAAQKIAETARIEADEQLRKDEAARKAREDAEQRSAARETEERRKEEERRAKWAADSTLIAEETARYVAKSEEYARLISGFEKQLAGLRVEKENNNRVAFSAARETELLAVKKRNAELEVQRVTGIVARRAASSNAILTGRPASSLASSPAGR